MKLIIQIALGVMLGILLSVLLGMMLWGSVLLKLMPVATPITSAPLASSHSTEAEKFIDPLEAQIKPTITVDSKITAEAEARAAQQQELERVAQEEKAKKDQAFKKWYHKPEECLSPNDHGRETKVNCANHYIRAKATFDTLWQRGEFKN